MEIYQKFSKMNKYIKQVLEQTFITKKIYISRLGGSINQYFSNFITNK